MKKIGNLLVVTGLVAGAGIALSFIGRGYRQQALEFPDLVDETSAESFPASDAPSWTGAALP